jgi:hypothetical protein
VIARTTHGARRPARLTARLAAGTTAGAFALGSLALGSLVLGSLVLGALPAAAAPATLPAGAVSSSCDRDWSVTQLDGSPITAHTMFAEQPLSPGATLDGAFLVTTGRDIRGPLELRAVRTGGAADAALEGELLLTLSGSSRAVTLPLSEFLDGGDSAQLVDTLSQGGHIVGVSVALPFSPTNTSQLGELPFQLLVTVSDTQTAIGGAPDPCGVDPTPSPSPSGTPAAPLGQPAASGPLASTGTAASAGVAWAAALLGAGFAAVFAFGQRRRGERADG